MGWNNGYSTGGPRHSGRSVAAPRPPSGAGRGAAAAAAAASRYGPKILFHGAGVGTFVLAAQTAIEGVNWWYRRNQVPTAFNNAGWTEQCSNGQAREDWTGRPTGCGNNITASNMFGGGYYHLVSFVDGTGGRTFRMSWWRYNGGGLLPYTSTAYFTKLVPLADVPPPGFFSNNEAYRPHYNWTPAYNYGGWRPGYSYPVSPVVTPIGSGMSSYPVKEEHRYSWGRTIGVGYVNQPGVTPRPVPVPRPIIVPVPIPGFPGVPLPTYPGTIGTGGTVIPGTGVGSGPISTPGIPGTVPVVVVPPIVTPIPVDPVVVVPRAPTYVQAGTSGVSLAHTAHQYAPPRSNMKEGKVKGVPRVMMTVVGTVTETLDVLDCLHKSLSYPRRAKKYKQPIKGKAVYDQHGLRRGFQWKSPRPVDKFHAVYDQWSHVDLPAAITCMYQEQLIDVAYGALGRMSGKAAAAARLHGNLPIGFETGYAH